MSGQLPKNKDFIFVAGILLLVVIITYSAFTTISIPQQKAGAKSSKQTHRQAKQRGKKKQDRAMNVQFEASESASATAQITAPNSQQKTRRLNAKLRKMIRRKNIIEKRMGILEKMSEEEYQAFRIGKPKLKETRKAMLGEMKQYLDRMEKVVFAPAREAQKAVIQKAKGPETEAAPAEKTEEPEAKEKSEK